MTSRTHGTLVLSLMIVAPLACGPGSGGSTGDEATDGTSTGDVSGSSTETDEPTGGSSTAEATTGGTSGSTTVGPDPDYVRECQEDDFTCSDWGCEVKPTVKPGECYKRCTPSVVGEVDDECDEPERPFCGQVGLALGGDFACNGCAHVCVAEPLDYCAEPIDSCNE
jgi:hypothetical protein